MSQADSRDNLSSEEEDEDSMEHTPERSFGQSPLLITEHLSQNEAG
jgi:hypothetical protein